MSKRTQRRNKNSNPILIIAGVVVLIAITLGAIFLFQPQAANEAAFPDEISVQEANQRVADGAWVVDVREPEEWEEYHMPDATLIPLGELSTRLSEIPTDREIIVVCRSGNRSATGRDILRQAGFNQVTSMAGGMSQWRSAGYPTVSGP